MLARLWADPILSLLTPGQLGSVQTSAYLLQAGPAVQSQPTGANNGADLAGVPPGEEDDFDEEDFIVGHPEASLVWKHGNALHESLSST